MKVENLPSKTLSIRISTNGFCFCIYDATDADSVRYHYRPADAADTLYSNLCKALEECPLDISGVTEIKAIVATTDFTTLPAEYDDNKNHKIFYRTCFPKTDTAVEIVANRLTAQSITVLFPIDKKIYERLAQMGDVSYYTTASILLGYIARCPLGDEKYILACYQGDMSFILSVNGGKIELINGFATPDATNQLYYLLSIWNAQDMLQVEHTLYLCGDKSVETVSPLLAKFIKNIKRVNPNELFSPNLLNKTGNIPFDLQALLLCE